MRLTLLTSIALLLVFSACGRNPGAQPRPYPIPGIAKIEAQIARSQPRCMSADFSLLKAKSVTVGKEHFTNPEGGRYKLTSYHLSEVVDRADRLVPSTTFTVTEFDQNIKSNSGEKAPRLAVEANCLDLKGEALELSVNPVSEIDAKSGLIVSSQPFQLNASAQGELRATTVNTVSATSPLPIVKTPETAILLGTEYMATFKTLKFIVDDADPKLLKVFGDFVGVDETFARKLIHIDATYAWDVNP